MDHVTNRCLIGNSLSQLLDDPFGCRMRGHIGMQDLATPMSDHEPDVEQLEARCRNDEKVHGAYGIAMIP